VFLRGFTEAIGVAVGMVVVYLGLNAVVVVVGLWQVIQHPLHSTEWTHAMSQQHGNPTDASWQPSGLGEEPIPWSNPRVCF